MPALRTSPEKERGAEGRENQDGKSKRNHAGMTGTSMQIQAVMLTQHSHRRRNGIVFTSCDWLDLRATSVVMAAR